MAQTSQAGAGLTPAQTTEIRAEMIPNGTPVRFLRGGKAVRVETGAECPRGTNIMHHPVYWNLPKATARKVANWIGAKAVFSA